MDEIERYFLPPRDDQPRIGKRRRRRPTIWQLSKAAQGDAPAMYHTYVGHLRNRRDGLRVKVLPVCAVVYDVAARSGCCTLLSARSVEHPKV